ncbi:MAG: hypothetical protein A2015_00445 [Spirochaetes bacterium GWF1_31_7]|nr:MAG: hypothetical protein A2Y30_04065 [Spirochaetes bacterium GWE1_32_154]OHD51054.1 MAG: hypothetical protein A2015_00445 [Spirochaetes bacterium GWF1_31_7]OHD82176.1 MAG: hypothetical protein A2355_14900 [Spirochaetes bacterium RIFOXYB1_FULL_32_8]HBD94376.1 hypothetical protein [Spirochaetia bacterium]HBI37871.1 hypothetical protein [Spirochaetia bacterium]
MNKQRRFFSTLFIIVIAIQVLISCSQNPFIGVGNSIDIEPPFIEIQSHKNMDFVGSTFVLSGIATDNLQVTNVIVKENRIKKEWTANLSDTKWSATITLPDGEYEFNVFALDARGNSSSKSFQVISLTVDSALPLSTISTPAIKTLAELQAMDNHSFENIDYFHNGVFNIKGFIDENFKIKTVNLILADQSGDIVFNKKIEHGAVLPENVTGSVWNWDFKIDTVHDILYKNGIDYQKKYYFNVRVVTTDMAGNEDNDTHGAICIYQQSDIPWNAVSLTENDIVPASGVISGNSYDDDSIGKVYIKIVPADQAVDFADYKNFQTDSSSDIISETVIDKSSDATRMYTWMIHAPRKAGLYTLYVVTDDVNGAIDTDFKVVHFVIPDIDNPVTVITSHTDQQIEFGNSAGDFVFSGYCYDNINIKRFSIAWGENDVIKDSLLKKSTWSNEASQIQWSANNIKFWEITQDLGIAVFDSEIMKEYGGRWKKSFSHTFNVNTDFTEYEDKLLFLYTEDNEGNFSVQRFSLFGDRVSPVLTISSPATDGLYLQDADGNRFVIGGAVTDNTGKVKKVTVKWKSIAGDINVDAVVINGNWSVSSETFGLTGGSQNFEIIAEDFYGNTTMGRRFVIVDNNTPVINNITATNESGYYNSGDVITINVEFSKNVIVTGGPSIDLNSSASAKAIYESGTGTSSLLFKYTIASGDNTTDLDCDSDHPVQLNGGTIKDSAQNSFVETFVIPGTARSLGANKDITIDTQKPFVQLVGSNTFDVTNDNYNAGKLISIQMEFNEPVTISGTPKLKLNVGTNRYASYTFGSSTKTLTFNYTVINDDNAPDLNYTSIDALELSGGTIKDLSGNEALITLPALTAVESLGGGRNIVIDTEQPDSPIIVEVDKENFTITAVEDLIQYSLDNGVWLKYTGKVNIPLKESTNIASRQMDKSGNFSEVTISTITADTTLPTIKNVTSSKPNGSYTTGEVIPISVQLSRNVVVTGTPLLLLETGATDRNALYVSGSGTSLLVFNYTVQAGDTAGILNYTDSNALTLNSGTINDSLDRPTALDLPSPDEENSLKSNKNIRIDTTKPLILSVNSGNANTSYTIGNEILISIELSEVVTVTGIPSLSLETGTIDTKALYQSGSGTSSLLFKYIVVAGNTSNDLDYVSVSSFDVEGGAITDIAGNTINATLPAPGATGSLGANKNITIDTTNPTVVNVTSPTSNGSFNEGKVVVVEVEYSEPVYVTGNPKILLETGTTDRSAVYAIGSGTTKLSFSYTVLSGDTASDLDYVSVNSLELNGGTIKDVTGNSASITLVSPGVAGSLGFNKNLIIDTTTPLIPGISGVVTGGNYKDNKTITITGGEPGAVVQYSLNSGSTWITYTAPFTVSSEGYYFVTARQRDVAGNQSTATNPTINFIIDKTPPAAPVISGLVAGTYNSAQSFTINGEPDATFEYTLDGGSTWFSYSGVAIPINTVGTFNVRVRQTDKALNVSALSNAIAVTIDQTSPGVTEVQQMSDDGSYNQNKVISLKVIFDKVVYVTGAPRLKLNSHSTAYANFVSGTGTVELTFSYIVGAGHGSSDLDYSATNSLELNSGTIRDLYTNDAVLALPAVGSASSLGGSANIIIDTGIPAAPGISGVTNAGIYKADKTVTLIGIEAGAIVQYSFDNGSTWFPGTSFTTVTDADSSKVYNVLAKQTDVAGNESPVSTGIAFTVDKQKPSPPVVAGIYAGTYSTDQTFTIQAIESSVEYSINNGVAWSSYSAAVTISAAGTYQVLSRQTDLAGNISDSSSAIIVTINKTPPSVSGVTSSTSDGYFNKDKVIGVSVTFTTAVYVTGVPRLKLNSNTTRYAAYALGSGSNTLTFSYTVQAGDAATDLDYSSTIALELNGGVIQDAIGNNAALTLVTPGTAGSLGANKDFVIDTTVPVAPEYSGVTNGATYNVDKNITITGESGAVFVYTLDDGLSTGTGSPAPATVLAGIKKDFTFKVKQRDQAGNESVFTSPISFTIDKIQPTIININSSSPDGIYKSGSIPVSITFSKVVTVTGAPQLTLNSGGIITFGASTGSTMTGNYTIGAGQNISRLDVNNSSALSLNGGTIKDASANNAILTLLTGSGTTGAFAYNKNIIVDTTAPGITTYSPAVGTNNVSKSANIVLTFSEDVYKETGTIEIIKKYNKFPLIMTIDEYNEWKNRVTGLSLDDYYTLGTNGAPGGVTDTVGKFVLKYSYDDDDLSLITAFTEAGYNKLSIDIQSTQVSIAGNVVTINPNSNFEIGTDYYVNISSTALRDVAGQYFAGIANTTTCTFVTGAVATPIIRINKQSGNGATQPGTTNIKISCATNGAALFYGKGDTSGNAPGSVSTSTTNNTEISIGDGSTSAGNKIYLKAYATRASLTDSDIAEEKAFKTVMDCGVANQPSNDTWYRGSNNTGGPTSAPGFPIAWEANLYDKVRKSNTNQEFVTWEINVLTYFKAISGYQGDYPAGPNGFRWQEGNNNVVNPGEKKTTGTDNWEAGWYTKGINY